MNELHARILEQRARALARPLPKADAADTTDFVMFSLAGETFALELGFVHEVSAAPAISVLPGAQAAIAGVMAWRGELLLVIDLAAVLELPVAGTPQAVIVVGTPRAEFAIAVERVSDIRTIDITQLHEVAGSTRRDCVRGLTADAAVVLESSQLRLYI